MTYVTPELEPVTAYPDQTGKLHWTREGAIEGNFNADLTNAIRYYCENHNNNMPPIGAKDFLKYMVDAYPDHLRILLGDRDYT